MFIFKFACACARFGIEQLTVLYFCTNELLANDNTFTGSECERTIKSAYNASRGVLGTAKFENEKLVDKVTNVS